MDLVRKDLDMSVGRWKAVLVAFALLSITAMGIEFLSAVATFERGIEGLWGVKRDRVMHDGQAAFVVREFAPWSLAPQSGLPVGDTVIPDPGYVAARTTGAAPQRRPLVRARRVHWRDHRARRRVLARRSDDDAAARRAD